MIRTKFSSTRAVPVGLVAVLAVGLCGLPSPSMAQSTQAEPAGRIDFDFANAPPAMIEVDLGHGLLSTVSGVVQASVEGAIEALRTSDQDDPSGAVQQSAEHLQAVQGVLALIGDVIHEVRVRVYGKFDDATQNMQASMVEHYQNRLAATNWNGVIQVRERNKRVIISVLEQDSGVRGLFVMVAGNRELVLLNIVGDLNPDKAKQLTQQATQIGLQVGLDRFIERAMADLYRAHRRTGFEASPPHARATNNAPAGNPAEVTQADSGRGD